jgi:hypothetical protein
LGKEAIKVKDAAGLTFPRILSLIINEAARSLEEGVAQAEEIDIAMRLGVNYPIGPLRWADQIGLDEVLAVLEGLERETGDDRYRPAPSIKKLVLAGFLGESHGRGFYTYNEEPGAIMKEAIIVEAVRTPMGRHSGILKDIRTDDLGAYIIAKLVQKTGINKEEIEDVYFGCTNQAGEDSRNVARNASLLAGLPYTVPGATVNRLCGSGLEAINQAGRAVATDHGDLFVAGGVESMTRGPWVMGKPAGPFQRGDVTMYDSSLGWRFPNKRMGELYSLINNGETAENVAEKYQISRQDQDAFALASHQKAVKAQEEGRLTDEVIPVEIPQRKGAPHGARQRRKPARRHLAGEAGGAPAGFQERRISDSG